MKGKAHEGQEVWVNLISDGVGLKHQKDSELERILFAHLKKADK